MVKSKLFSFRPQFEIYENGEYIGCIRQEYSFGKQSFTIDFNNWKVDGDFRGRQYAIMDRFGYIVARLSRVRFQFNDTYELEVLDSQNALLTFMIIMAIDSAKEMND